MPDGLESKYNFMDEGFYSSLTKAIAEDNLDLLKQLLKSMKQHDRAELLAEYKYPISKTINDAAIEKKTPDILDYILEQLSSPDADKSYKEEIFKREPMIEGDHRERKTAFMNLLNLGFDAKSLCSDLSREQREDVIRYAGYNNIFKDLTTDVGITRNQMAKNLFFVCDYIEQNDIVQYGYMERVPSERWKDFTMYRAGEDFLTPLTQEIFYTALHLKSGLTPRNLEGKVDLTYYQVARGDLTVPNVAMFFAQYKQSTPDMVRYSEKIHQQGGLPSNIADKRGGIMAGDMIHLFDVGEEGKNFTDVEIDGETIRFQCLASTAEMELMTTESEKIVARKGLPSSKALCTGKGIKDSAFKIGSSAFVSMQRMGKDGSVDEYLMVAELHSPTGKIQTYFTVSEAVDMCNNKENSSSFILDSKYPAILNQFLSAIEVTRPSKQSHDIDIPLDGILITVNRKLGKKILGNDAEIANSAEEISGMTQTHDNLRAAIGCYIEHMGVDVKVDNGMRIERRTPFGIKQVKERLYTDEQIKNGEVEERHKDEKPNRLRKRYKITFKGDITRMVNQALELIDETFDNFLEAHELESYNKASIFETEKRGKVPRHGHGDISLYKDEHGIPREEPLKYEPHRIVFEVDLVNRMRQEGQQGGLAIGGEEQ